MTNKIQRFAHELSGAARSINEVRESVDGVRQAAQEFNRLPHTIVRGALKVGPATVISGLAVTAVSESDLPAWAKLAGYGLALLSFGSMVLATSKVIDSIGAPPHFPQRSVSHAPVMELVQGDRLSGANYGAVAQGPVHTQGQTVHNFSRGVGGN